MTTNLEKAIISAEEVQRLLDMTDLEAHSKRVGAYVAQYSESLRRANIDARRGPGEILLY
ncbi:hypothetical protein KA107_01115 [Candidatus Pacearchaeota archaeon]|nr:hypothetical protein [Candidatus Pacearchaeota archaeon]